MNAAFERAIVVAGGPARLLAELRKMRPESRLKPGHLYHWRRKMEVLPAEYCPDVEAISRAAGEVVTCEELNPTVRWSVLREHPFPKDAANDSTVLERAA